MGTPLGELDRARLRAIAASDRPLAPHECAERARRAAALIEPGRLDRSGPGEAVLLWRDEHSEAWLNLWWRPRDTGYHDHTGSCVGVHVIEGRAWNEPLTIGTPPEARAYGPGETFWFPGEGIHRMDHQAGAVTIHVYSPPIRAIGHYDLHDGQLRRSQGSPDQPSPPSAALYEALHPPADADPADHGVVARLWRHCRCDRGHTLFTARDRPRLKRRALPPIWSTSRSAQIKAVTVPDLDVLLSFERQYRLVISLSCTARLGTGDQDLPHVPVD
jgi:hypothetical protein